ncbi:MAG: PA14 domain-containing protein [Haloarculaceae archaeon]
MGLAVLIVVAIAAAVLAPTASAAEPSDPWLSQKYTKMVDDNTIRVVVRDEYSPFGVDENSIQPRGDFKLINHRTGKEIPITYARIKPNIDTEDSDTKSSRGEDDAWVYLTFDETDVETTQIDVKLTGPIRDTWGAPDNVLHPNEAKTLHVTSTRMDPDIKNVELSDDGESLYFSVVDYSGIETTGNPWQGFTGYDVEPSYFDISGKSGRANGEIVHSSRNKVRLRLDVPPRDNEPVTVSVAENLDDYGHHSLSPGESEGTFTVHGVDNQPPHLVESGRCYDCKKDTRTIQFHMRDGSGVDVSNVYRGKFDVSAGRITHVEASGSGHETSTTVTMSITPVDTNRITVSTHYNPRYGGAFIGDAEDNYGVTGQFTVPNMDGVPPTFESVRKVDDTTIQATFTDGVGIDESSISAGDFAVSDGSVSSVSVRQIPRSDSYITTIDLARPVDASSVDVSITGVITDTSGNALTSGTKTVTGMDGVAPKFASVSAVDPTTLKATITDGNDVDESTITADDFAVREGSISSISTSESGSDATVTLHLAKPVDASSVDVSITGSIADTSGNALTSGTKTAANVDGVAPKLTDVSAVDPTTLKATITDGVGVDSSSIAATDFAVTDANEWPQGINYAYYENPDPSDGYRSLSDVQFDSTPERTGRVNELVFPDDHRDEQWAAELTGYIDAPQTGEYTFWLYSDDGSALYIDGKQVLANDGIHSFTKKKSNPVHLSTGNHRIRVRYFNGPGDEKLRVDWGGPGIATNTNLLDREISIAPRHLSAPTGGHLVDDVTTSTSGSKTTATIHLAKRLDSRTARVALTGNGIDDTSGNTLAADTTTVSGMDGVAPAFASASKVDDTTIKATITDGVDVDESTITADDFAVSAGSISSVSTGESGSDATATLHLAKPVDTSSVDVSITGAVADAAGNELTSGTQTVTGMDGVAPTFASASKVDDTTIKATITDGVDVDESTITADDFAVSSGSISSISTGESGSDATVTLHLAKPVATPTVDVSITGAIADTAGNELTTGTQTVTGMDGVGPTLDSAHVTGDTEIELQLADGSGVDVDTVTKSDFALDDGTIRSLSAAESGSDAVVTLHLASPLAVDSTTLSLVGAVDDVSGNTRTSGSITIHGTDTTPPVLASAAQIGPKTLEVRVTDGVDVDESSIALTDFSPTTGTVETMSVHEQGSTAVVDLVLESPINTQSLSVRLVGTIADTAGNEQTTGTVTISNTDGVPPRLASASKVDDTTIEATITDGVDVDENTIRAGDFAVSAGTIASISTVENGSNADVTLHLAKPVDDDTVTVSVDGSFADAANNVRRSGSVTVSGMDGVAPSLGTATMAGPTTIELTVTDGVDVDESSITTADFATSSGQVKRVTAVESGSNAVVDVYLAHPLRKNTVRVSVVGSIADAAGNERTTGTTVVHGADGNSPSLAGGTLLDPTEVRVTVSDEVDVDESSITASDFDVAPGRITDVTVTESGSDATVTLQLANPVSARKVTVSMNGELRDEAGNVLHGDSVVVSNADGVAPRLDGATMVDDTTVRVELTDGVDVDESTMSASDFALSTGSIRQASVTERGTDAVVTLDLAKPVDTDRLTISLVGSVADAAGNERTSGTVAVSNADGVAPTLASATMRSPTAVQVRVTDGVDVDESTITADDFAVSAGTIRSVTPVSSGTDTIVRMTLSKPVGDDHLDVRVVGSIADVAGNELTRGSVTAADADDTAPALDGGTAVDATTLHVRVSDDVDVDEGTITADDFAVSAGTIRSISTAEAGSDATVTLHLAKPVDASRETVTLVGSVADAAGNALSSGSVTIEHVDGVAPTFDGATLLDRRTIRVRIDDGGGVEESSIDESDFRVSPGHIDDVSATTSGTHATVTIQLAGPVDAGTVTVGFPGSIADRAGNRRTSLRKPLTVTGSDGGAPTIAGATRRNETAIELNVSDGVDVDESSITADDFTLSAGTVAGVDVTENGSNADVTLLLADSVDADDVTVTLTGSIRDAAGNVRTSASASVSGMDGVAPVLAGASRVDDTTIEVRLTDGVDVDESTITAGDFAVSSGGIAHVSTRDTGSATTVTLVLASKPATESVRVRLAGDGVADTAGNVRTTGSVEVTGVDAVGPIMKDAKMIGPRTIELDITDRGNVDESTISAGDFEVSHGRVVRAVAVEDTDGATVRVVLENAVDAKSLKLTLSDQTAITDVAGNPVQGPPLLTVDGVDGVPPRLANARLTDHGTLQVRLTDGTGVDASTVSGDDFVIDGADATYAGRTSQGTDVVATYDLPANLEAGNVTVRLADDAVIEDANGNRLTDAKSLSVGAVDDVAPRLANVTRVSPTTLDVWLHDGVGVEEGSITADDFAVSDATVVSAFPVDYGSDTRVRLTLAEPSTTAGATVSITDRISDVDGNVLTDGNLTIPGGDDRPPRFTDVVYVSDTTLDVWIRDNYDVDEGTITAADFVVSNATVVSAFPADRGHDTRVRLTLADPLAGETTTVSIAPDGSIEDTAGNALTGDTGVSGAAGGTGSGGAANETGVSGATGDTGAGGAASETTASGTASDTGASGATDAAGGGSTGASITVNATDSVAPTVVGMNVTSPRTIRVTFEDDGSGIDPTSVSTSDFRTTAGTVTAVNVSKSYRAGRRQVTLRLAKDAPSGKQVMVFLSGNGVADHAGNALDYGIVSDTVPTTPTPTPTARPTPGATTTTTFENAVTPSTAFVGSLASLGAGLYIHSRHQEAAMKALEKAADLLYRKWK